MALRIGIIVGSLRTGSYNQLLASRIEAALAARGVEVWRPAEEASGLPIYHGDRDHDDFPPAARRLKQGLARCSGIVLVSPEYNGSTSPLLKNILDWASRSTDGEPPLALTGFRGKPIALASASVGPYGGVRALGHVRQIVQTLQAIALPEEIRIPVATTAFDESGALVSDVAMTQLDRVVDRLIAVAGQLIS